MQDDVWINRIGTRLLREPGSGQPESELKPDWLPDGGFTEPPRPAAVLIGLVRRPEGLTVLYTERSPDLRSHSGQVSFPGGRIEVGETPAEAALREAEEEIALAPAEAEVLGFMPSYFTGSNYLITPVVAVVAPTQPFIPNPGEVRSVFEVPLQWLADEASYGTYRIRRGEIEHTTWQLDHAGIRIWGITANLTRRFRDLALAAEPS
jgi:8-oxo-dGTP pyrophosphatase MutT (NUDIX family)